MSGCQSLTLNGGNAAQLRVIDASPDVGLLDSYQNSAGLAYNLAFGTVTTYVPMLPGSYVLGVDKAGTRQTLLSSGVSLTAGHQYTELIGNVAGGLQQTLLQDRTQPAPAGEMALRLVMQAVRPGGVDVYLVPKGGRLAGVGPVWSNVGFNSATGYVEVAVGTYALAVVPTGTVPTNQTTTLLSGPQVSYPQGCVRTIVLVDAAQAGDRDVSTPTVQALVAEDVDGSN